MEIKKIADWNPLIDELIKKSGQEFYLLLTGDLGAGKTTFTKQLFKGLGIEDVVNSPTFVILNQYFNKENQLFNHMDAYRLSKNDDVELYQEQFVQAFNVIEWPEKLKIDFSKLPGWHLDIKIIDENRREIKVIKNLNDWKGD